MSQLLNIGDPIEFEYNGSRLTGKINRVYHRIYHKHEEIVYKAVIGDPQAAESKWYLVNQNAIIH